MAVDRWFTVLGPVRAWQAETELDVGSAQQRAVLATLLLRRGTPVSVEDVIDALWDEDVPSAAVGTVRTYISRLRRVLDAGAAAGPVIRSVSGGYQVDLSADELDLAVFQRRLADAERARDDNDVATWASELARGLELWNGTPLAGVPGPFASQQRTRLEQLRVSAETTRLRAELDTGDPHRLLAELSALAEEHPLDEQLRELLIIGLYRAGRQADALAAYQDIRSLLASELGIDPGPALQALHGRILRADPALMPASAGQPRTAEDVLPARSPHGPVLRGNLPAQASSFVGRDEELAQVRALVAGARLVTLTGSGGAGKTRLALQVAAGLLDGTGDGVWFADLAPLRDPDLVAETVADVLGVPRDPGRPVTEALVEAVGGRSLLVLLDNCEHMVDACAKLADALLRGCPNLALLATSREPLGIGGEWVYRVPSMGVPAEGADTSAIAASEAVRLLADRAAAQGVPLAWDEEVARVAGRICRRLDGIPMAIELAAARLRAMPAAELEDRLDERFSLLTGGSRAALPRQQTLRAMVDWSWELLTGSEQAVLARLSAFAGGFGLAAAEAVAAGADVSDLEVLGHLGALVDKSLVQFGDSGAGPGRYRLLETIRQYAANRVDTDPATASEARIAHRDYYLAFAELAASQLKTAHQAGWLARLDAEADNLRAAIAFSATQPDLGPGLRLAASLGVYWKVRGRVTEGAELLRALLEAPAARAATLPRAHALAALASLDQHAGDYARADASCLEALPIARAAGASHLVIDLLSKRAWTLKHQGRPGDALTLIESGLELARRLGDLTLTARLLCDQATALNDQGDPAAAVLRMGEAVRLFRQAGDQRMVGTMLGNLGYQELTAGRLDAARRHLAEALGIARELGDCFTTAHQTFNLGLAEYLAGAPDAAEALFTESFDLAQGMGLKASMAYALIGLALADPGKDAPGRPARLHGAADQALADLGHALEPLESRLADRDRRRLRVALGDEAFAAEYAAGRTLSPAKAISDASTAP